uniref:Interferon related developmental regulator 1 n=1 Tax=Molossus molossus TaxID=27622 RepID=A0A7J8HBZ2_MOLMO|nr:interferon related developmental regulator 1 [Molossus molossus]
MGPLVPRPDRRAGPSVWQRTVQCPAVSVSPGELRLTGLEVHSLQPPFSTKGSYGIPSLSNT